MGKKRHIKCMYNASRGELIYALGELERTLASERSDLLEERQSALRDAAIRAASEIDLKRRITELEMYNETVSAIVYELLEGHEDSVLKATVLSVMAEISNAK